MGRKSHWNFQLLVADVLVLAFFFNVAYRLRLGHWESHYLWSINALYVIGTLILTVYVLDGYDLRSRLLGVSSATRFFLAGAIALLMTVFVTYALGLPFADAFGRGVLAGAYGGSVIFGSLMRRALQRALDRSQRHKPWLVLINRERIEKFERDVHSGRKLGTFHYLAEEEWPKLQSHLNSGHWSGVIVAWSGEVGKDMVTTLLNSRFQGLGVISAEDFYERSLEKMPVYWLDQRLLMTADGFGFFANPMSHRIKRIADLLLSILLAPFALLLVFFGGLSVFLESGGPIFYSQNRLGLDRKVFRIHKLRTMRQNAEAAGAVWAQERDPRITRVGNFLRKTRLDEMPQLWNIFIGEMSFIGPRPERPEFSDDLEAQIPYYGLRHWVRPGLTGWAQVCYRYGASVEDSVAKLEFDLYYIKNHSLLLDVSILIRTLRVVLMGAGR